MSPYRIINATVGAVPIIVSVPHCGTQFPEELQSELDPKLIASPDDTDWFVEELYDFVGSMGMSMIHANYSRWVIDLNRDPQSKPLYTDGRIITGLCPTTTFLGEPLYRDKRHEVSKEDSKQRIEKYYRPYHEELSKLLEKTKSKFGTVLLWDCHSIRHVVKTIQPNKFPDLNLGDNDESSASPILIQEAIAGLTDNEYSFSHNHPFKGGYITRYFGKPQESQHALQLEMNKSNYMDDTETTFHPVRASKIRDVLKRTFERLIGVLS